MRSALQAKEVCVAVLLKVSDRSAMRKVCGEVKWMSLLTSHEKITSVQLCC